MSEGARVEVRAGRLVGQQGTVVASWREGSCGCLTVLVRMDTGRDWVGKATELGRVR